MESLVQIQNENTEILTINSKEVAEMVGTRHKNLLRKIDEVNRDFNERNIEPVKY